MLSTAMRERLSLCADCRKGHTTDFPRSVRRKSIKLLRGDAGEGDCQPSSGSRMSIVFPYGDGGNGAHPCLTDNSGGWSHSGMDSSMLSRPLCLLSGPGFITPSFLRLLFPQLSDFSFSFYTSQLSCFRLCRLMSSRLYVDWDPLPQDVIAVTIITVIS